MAKTMTASNKSGARKASTPAAKTKAVHTAKKKPAAQVKTAVKKAARPLATKSVKKSPSKKSGASVRRYKCRICGYIYSPLMGEPHNGIPAGTAFDDLPDDYVCPVCGFQGKGRIGKWGFDEWRPTRYVCSMCDYVYDEARGEPHRGIKPGTKFEDLPEDYVCPVCATDPKIVLRYGNVMKQGFSPLNM
jgi:rubredoxin